MYFLFITAPPSHFICRLRSHYATAPLKSLENLLPRCGNSSDLLTFLIFKKKKNFPFQCPDRLRLPGHPLPLQGRLRGPFLLQGGAALLVRRQGPRARHAGHLAGRAVEFFQTQQLKKGTKSITFLMRSKPKYSSYYFPVPG